MRRGFIAVAALVLGVLCFAAGSAQQPSPSEPSTPKFHPPEIVQTADAVYPINSVAFGTVVFEVHLDAAGEIEDVQMSRDIPSLTQPATDAVKRWKFKPATLDGKPVATVALVAFTFVRPDLLPRFGGTQPKQ